MAHLFKKTVLENTPSALLIDQTSGFIKGVVLLRLVQNFQWTEKFGQSGWLIWHCPNLVNNFLVKYTYFAMYEVVKKINVPHTRKSLVKGERFIRCEWRTRYQVVKKMVQWNLCPVEDFVKLFNYFIGPTTLAPSCSTAGLGASW